MEFFELIFVLSLTVVLPIVFTKMVIDYKRQKMEARRAELEPREGMTLGELKRTLREVVEEANLPLAERIEALERLALPAPKDSSYAEDDSFYGEHLEEEPTKTVGRRVTG